MRTSAATATQVPLGRGRPLLLAAALGIVYVLWGSTYLAIRIIGEVPPLIGAGTRFLAAGLLVAGVLALRGGLGGLALTRRQLLGCSLLGLMMLVLRQGLVAVCLGWFILAEPITMPTLVGGVMVVMAVAVVVRSETQR